MTFTQSHKATGVIALPDCQLSKGVKYKLRIRLDRTYFTKTENTIAK